MQYGKWLAFTKRATPLHAAIPPCSKPSSGYNPATINELQLAAAIGSRNAYNSFFYINLRPSTQVD
jgi:hypothetical protein